MHLLKMPVDMSKELGWGGVAADVYDRLLLEQMGEGKTIERECVADLHHNRSHRGRVPCPSASKIASS